MTREARLMCGLILITVPTIQYGGYFLLTSLMNKNSGYMENPLRQNFFRAGHAHAGVFVIFALTAQILADAAHLHGAANVLARDGIWAAAILFPVGFFGSSAGPGATRPNRLIVLLYLGAAALTAGVLTLGIGLLSS